MTTEGVFTFQFLHRITVMKTAIKFKICRFMYIAIANTIELENKLEYLKPETINGL